MSTCSAKSSTGRETRLLSVSVRRTFARALQDALAAEDFTLHVLDGDHFSAEHYLTSRHPNGCTGPVLLVGLKRGRIDVSVLEDGNLVDYGIRTECTPEACTAMLTEYAGTHGRSLKVLLYGPRATSNMLESLVGPGIPPIEVLNPFAGMDIAPGNPPRNTLPGNATPIRPRGRGRPSGGIEPMRVTGGEFRGRILRTVDDFSVRPATDRVRQTLSICW